MYTPPTVHRTVKQTIDWKIVICYLLLVLIGWVNIYAAGHSSEVGTILDFDTRSGKQFIWIITAFILATLILFVFNPRLWEVISIPTYVCVVLLLVGVIFLGVEIKGSRSWFALGPVRFQPAEISKISTSLVLATVMSRINLKHNNTRNLLMIAAIIGIPMLAILAESETGSALVYLGFIFVLYREGLSGWLLAFIGLAILLFILTLVASPYAAILTLVGLVSLGCCYESDKVKLWFFLFVPLIVILALLPKYWVTFFEGTSPMIVLLILSGLAIPVLAVMAFKSKRNIIWVSLGAFIAGAILVFSTNFIFNNILQDHQRKRIEVLLGMKEDPTGIGYNVNQSMIAIGSGGLTGKGFLKGTQTAFGFVPEQSTDFIFCTVGEEWGFIGCLAVILLYIIMIYRIITDAEQSRETFTRIYGYSVASLISMHLFINIGMTIGLMPVIGIPLPFLSYGGSSLWAFTVLLFIFIALDKQENKYF